MEEEEEEERRGVTEQEEVRRGEGSKVGRRGCRGGGRKGGVFETRRSSEGQQPQRPVSEVIMVLITVGAASLIRSQPAADGVNRCTGNT